MLNLFRKSQNLCDLDPEINLNSTHEHDGGKTITINALSGDRNQKMRNITLKNIEFDFFRFGISEIEVDLIEKTAIFKSWVEYGFNNNENIEKNELFEHVVDIEINEKKSKMEQIDEIKKEINEIMLDEFSYAMENGFSISTEEQDSPIKSEAKNKNKNSIGKIISKILLGLVGILALVLVVIFVSSLFGGKTTNQETIKQEIPNIVNEQVGSIESQGQPESNDDLERETLSEFGLEPDVSLQ